MKLVSFSWLFVNHTNGPSWWNNLSLQGSMQPFISILSFMQFVQEVALKTEVKLMQVVGSADATHVNSGNTHFAGAGETKHIFTIPPIIFDELD